MSNAQVCCCHDRVAVFIALSKQIGGPKKFSLCDDISEYSVMKKGLSFWSNLKFKSVSDYSLRSKLELFQVKVCRLLGTKPLSETMFCPRWLTQYGVTGLWVSTIFMMEKLIQIHRPRTVTM